MSQTVLVIIRPSNFISHSTDTVFQFTGKFVTGTGLVIIQKKFQVRSFNFCHKLWSSDSRELTQKSFSDNYAEKFHSLKNSGIKFQLG